MKIKFCKTKLFFFLVYIVFLSPVASTEIKKLVTHGGFAFETMDGQKNSAAYISFFNNSNQNFTINSVKTDIANKVEIHDIQIEEDIVKMVKLKSLNIGKKEQVFLQPGGKHIMLFGLKRKLQEGEKFKISFVFENKDEIIAEIFVVNKNLRENYIN
tara:strand:+ start:28 stop:498 length:471 start_codon:yes stop_codon:yes gene_type:complete